MPIAKYNAQFGGKPGSAAKAKAAMAKEYGAEKGERVFYATKNKRKAQGMKAGGKVGVRGSRALPGRHAQAAPNAKGGFNVQPGFMCGGKV